MLRVQSTAATTTVLALASRGGRRALVALWQSGAAPWTVARPLALGSGASVRSTAVNTAGDVAVLLGGRTGGTPCGPGRRAGGAWNQLPRLPAQDRGAGPAARARSPSSGPDIDAFTVAGESLGVFSLTPSGKAWARVQSSQIPLAYGSSS